MMLRGAATASNDARAKSDSVRKRTRPYRHHSRAPKLTDSMHSHALSPNRRAHPVMAVTVTRHMLSTLTKTLLAALVYGALVITAASPATAQPPVTVTRAINGTYMGYNADQALTFTTRVARRVLLITPSLTDGNAFGQTSGGGASVRIAHDGSWYSRGVTGSPSLCGFVRGAIIKASTRCRRGRLVGAPLYVARRVVPTIAEGVYTGAASLPSGASGTMTVNVQGGVVSAQGQFGATIVTFAALPIGGGSGNPDNGGTFVDASGEFSLVDQSGAYTISGTLFPAGVRGAPSSSGYVLGNLQPTCTSPSGCAPSSSPTFVLPNQS
jgi:hypothetical protein